MSGVLWPGTVMTVLREERLANGLQIIFVDESNRYFGDYHRVCVTATIVCSLCELPVADADDEAFRRQAIAAFGEQLNVTRRFERMGVPAVDVEKVRTALIEDFLKHAASYLSRPGYLRALVSAELNKRNTQRSYD